MTDFTPIVLHARYGLQSVPVMARVNLFDGRLRVMWEEYKDAVKRASLAPGDFLVRGYGSALDVYKEGELVKTIC